MRLRDLFGRRRGRRVPGHVPDSPIDWRSGDIAVCVEGEPWEDLKTQRPEPGPALREICRVRSVVLIDGRQFLGFREYPDGVSFSACYFDRLRPAEADFERRLRRIRPTPARPRELERA